MSPSSDYYSLSPASPTPGVTPSSTAESIVSQQQQQQQQPIYARVVKSKTEEEGLVCAPVNEANGVVNKISDDKHLRAPPQVTRAASVSKKPLAPARSTSTPDKDKPDSRRHSWAGDRKGEHYPCHMSTKFYLVLLISKCQRQFCEWSATFQDFLSLSLSGPVSITPKKTSLQDFKKLLAQQSLGPNPHRPTARELLERSAQAKAGVQEPGHGASPGKAGGSLRKRNSPWVDKRFSVIQEEVEGSRENIIE